MTSTADAAALASAPAAAPANAGDVELAENEPADVELTRVELAETVTDDGVGSAVVGPGGARVIPLSPPAGTLPSADGSPLADALQSPLVRAVRAQTLTAPAGLILAVTLLLPGVLIDLLTDATAGRPTAISFLVAAAVPPLVVRRKALGTAAVAPPVLFASALLMLAWGSGQNATNRQVVMDAGTSLGLTAPHLFAGTVVAVVLVLARLSWGLVHRD